MTITQPITFHVEECCACGVVFAMTQEFYNARWAEKERGEFYCPNGHSQHYVGKSDKQKAREAEARYLAEVDQRKAAERELKRHRTRAKGGACPVCKRSFVQLARHVKTQHPDFEP